jgi:hypothetical protein
MKFNYTALSTDNQKLTGVLDAESLEAAKEELHKMGLSIISTNEISEAEFEELQKKEVEEKVKVGIQTFTFECIDPNGKDVNGTIDAKDAYTAYKRLMVEYKFTVNAIYSTAATDEEKAKSKEQLEEFAIQLEEEGIQIEEKGKEEDEAAERISGEVVKEIDKFIINAKKVLGEHSDIFSNEFRKEIEKTLGELERVRTSSNLKHISAVCNQLYELISNPDKLPEDAEEADTAYRQIVDNMKDTAFVRKEFDLHTKAIGLDKIQDVLSRTLGKMFGRKEKKLDVPKGLSGKPKTGIQKFLSKFTKKKKPKTKEPEKPGLATVIGKLFAFVFAPNAVLRLSKKQELIKTYKAWRAPKKPKEAVKTKEGVHAGEAAVTEEGEAVSAKEKIDPGKKDFSPFFMEVDSFIAWLLFFYIFYFFLVNFSLEKGLGIPRDFIIKTLKTPLILNITIFLLFAHLLLKIKTQYFRQNFIGSVFLLFFGFSLYLLLIINF